MSGRSSAVTPQSFATFGELLHYLRERAGLSQRELALQVGYHYSYMSRIEKNERIPDAATLMARFVPALGLENEPQWTSHLLQLATGAEKNESPLTGIRTTPAAPAPKPETVSPGPDAALNPLPVSLTPLLGREKETETLVMLLARNDVRLVTLVGAPGVGKTRLALHVANQIQDLFAHGAVFVNLAAVSDEKGVLPAFAGAFGVMETSDSELMARLLHFLRQRNLLIVADNFEHLIAAAPQLIRILGASPETKIIVTSREALHVPGEHEFTVEPLPVPRVSDEPSEEFTSIQLFVQRAQAVKPDFQRTNQNLNAIAEICRRLDGLPLAIELAAPRIKMLNPQAMLAQFDRHLDWVARGVQPARQTLRGALEWSHNLLSENKKVLMRRLSVFSGGWTPESAEAVCADVEPSDSPASVRREDIFDLLIQLVDRSLLVTEKMEDETRFRFLEIIHAFGREKLAQSDEELEMRNRHLAFFAEFAEEGERNLYGVSPVKWAAAIEREYANIRAALDWGLRAEASLNDGLRLAASVSRFWIRRSHFREGIEWLHAYLARAGDPEHETVRAKMLFRAGGMAAYMFDFDTAARLCQQSLELSRALENKRSVAAALFYMSEIALGLRQPRDARIALEEGISLCRADYYPQLLSLALTNLGLALDMEGNYKDAQSTILEGLAIAKQVGDTWGMSRALLGLGDIHRLNEHYDEAIDYLERNLEVTRKLGDRYAEGITLANLSNLYTLKDEFGRSEQCADRAFAIFQNLGDEVQQPFPLRMMGYAAIHSGNLVRARVLIRESLKGNRALEHIPGQFACMVALAQCHLAEKNAKQAVSLCGLIEKHLLVDGVKLMHPDVKALTEVLGQAKKKLGTAAYEAAYRAGQSMILDDTILELMTG
jgi:predicted ATPase